jgi:hypothetical protein
MREVGEPRREAEPPTFRFQALKPRQPNHEFLWYVRQLVRGALRGPVRPVARVSRDGSPDDSPERSQDVRSVPTAGRRKCAALPAHASP